MATFLSDFWRAYRHPRVLTLLLLGFSAGLPYLLVFSTLSAWLSESGIQRSTIGFFSWVGILFSLKVLWSPLVDQLKLPFLSRLLGQRRAWLLLAQLGILAALLAISLTNPADAIIRFAWLALLVAFCAATQDICIDAYRIEAAPESLQGALAAAYILGYRIALLVSGAGAFYLAAFQHWGFAYQCMAGLMLVGIITTLSIGEPEVARRHTEFLGNPIRWLEHSLLEPFQEFFTRFGKHALTLLLFVGIYRLSDITMGVMANPFYLESGYSKTEIANIAKVFGFLTVIVGSFLGGIFVSRYGLYRSLLLGAVLAATTNLLFALMAVSPKSLALLALVISADNLGAGFANVAFIAYLSSLVNREFTATQYALFSSLMTLPGKTLAGFSGVIVDAISYPLFFIYSAALGIPAIFLTLYLMQKFPHSSQDRRKKQAKNT